MLLADIAGSFQVNAIIRTEIESRIAARAGRASLQEEWVLVCASNTIDKHTQITSSKIVVHVIVTASYSTTHCFLSYARMARGEFKIAIRNSSGYKGLGKQVGIRLLIRYHP